MSAAAINIPTELTDAQAEAVYRKLYPYARGLGDQERKMARQIYTHVREALSEPRTVKVTAWALIVKGIVCDITHSERRVDEWRRGLFGDDAIIPLTGEYEVQP